MNRGRGAWTELLLLILEKYRETRVIHYAATLESFGDVIGHRYGGSLQLVAEAAVMAKEIVTSELQHGLGQPGSVLPYWQVFKMVISHGGKQNYKLR